MLKKFVTYAEAATALGASSESLRQALEIDFSFTLPAYLYCGDFPHLAVIEGYRVGATEDEEHAFGEDPCKLLVAENAPPIGNGFVFSDVVGRLEAEDLGDLEAEVVEAEIPRRLTGHPVCFTLRGYFRVNPVHVREGARGRGFRTVELAPGSWWSESSPMPRNDDGSPAFMFRIVRNELSAFKAYPDFDELLFRTSDIDALKHPERQPTGTPAAEATPSGQKPQKLRSDRETNLLRVIAGLLEFSSLPPEPNKAADKLSALFDGWGWEKPTAGTIADTVLADAKKLPRITKPPKNLPPVR